MTKSEYKKIMAENIQYYLYNRGVTRQQFADALQIPYTTLANWLQGLNYPRIDKIEKMAAYFQITSADLIEGKTISSGLWSSKPITISIPSAVWGDLDTNLTKDTTLLWLIAEIVRIYAMLKK